MTTSEKKICCICQNEIDGKYGHNAEPVKSGRCCSPCNHTIVLPTRLKQFFQTKGKQK
jgi:hypothetical protein